MLVKPIKKHLFCFCLITILSCFILSCNKCQENTNSEIIETGVYLEKNISSNGFNLPYRILYPRNFNPNDKFPVLFFLHGAGERGNNNSSQLSYGSQMFLDSIDSYPAIIVYPQCASNQWWANNSNGDILPNGFPPFTSNNLEPIHSSIKLLELLIDSISTLPYIDSKRIYIAGLSMGAMGTTQILSKKPDLFAAAAVIAGIAPLHFSENLRQTPSSIYHGLQDDIVLPNHSQDYFLAIDDSTQKHRLTLYSGLGHNSWTTAFNEPDFLSWIFSKTR